MFLFHKKHTDSYWISTKEDSKGVTIDNSLKCDFYETESQSEYLLVRVVYEDGRFYGKVVSFKCWVDHYSEVSKSLPNEGKYEPFIRLKYLLEKIALDVTMYMREQQKMEHKVQDHSRDCSYEGDYYRW